jgi:hypothetical protein
VNAFRPGAQTERWGDAEDLRKSAAVYNTDVPFSLVLLGFLFVADFHVAFGQRLLDNGSS